MKLSPAVDLHIPKKMPQKKRKNPSICGVGYFTVFMLFPSSEVNSPEIIDESPFCQIVPHSNSAWISNLNRLFFLV